MLMKFVSYVYTVEPLLDSLSIIRTEGQFRYIVPKFKSFSDL